jgi:amino acid transporter
MNASNVSIVTDIREVVEANGELPRRLGLTALVLLIIAFNAPIAAMAGFAQLSIGFGNGIGAPVSFLVAGAILLVFSVGFVGMSRFIDNPGAFYQFIVAGMGRSAGLAGAFLATMAYLLLCAGSYPYLGLVAVDVTTRLFGHSFLQWYLWSAFFLVVITTIGFFRIDLSMKILGKLVILEIALVAIWQIAVIFQGGPQGYAPESYTLSAFMHGSSGLGVLFAMLCMIGIEAGACFSAETRNPEVTVGRATYISIVFMAIFYSLGSWLYIVTQGTSNAVSHAISDPVGSFFNSVQSYLGIFFVHAVAITLLTSQMVAISSIQGSASRYLFALGRDRVLPPILARVHRRLESPYIAVSAVALISGTILAVVSALGISPVASYAALTGMGLYFLLPLMIGTSISIILFYLENPHFRANAWVRLIAPLASALALLTLFVLTSLNLKTFVGTSDAAIVSMIAVVVVPVAGWLLAHFYKRHRPTIFASIGNQ